MWDSLFDDASAQLTMALSDVCHEPFIETEPCGIDGGTHRILVRPLVIAILAVNEDKQTIRIYDIQPRR